MLHTTALRCTQLCPTEESISCDTMSPWTQEQWDAFHALEHHEQVQAHTRDYLVTHLYYDGVLTLERLKLIQELEDRPGVDLNYARIDEETKDVTNIPYITAADGDAPCINAHAANGRHFYQPLDKAQYFQQLNHRVIHFRER